MGGIVGIGRGDADEQVLIGFAGQQIAVLQRVLAEIGEQRIAAVIDLDRIELRDFASFDSERRVLGAFAFVAGASHGGGRHVGGTHFAAAGQVHLIPLVLVTFQWPESPILRRLYGEAVD